MALVSIRSMLLASRKPDGHQEPACTKWATSWTNAPEAALNGTVSSTALTITLAHEFPVMAVVQVGHYLVHHIPDPGQEHRNHSLSYRPHMPSDKHIL